MISLRVLGALDLEGPPGSEPQDVLGGSKRMALLVYLALARPRGLQRRDSIVAVLWPELDQERARAALRHTLYVLRRALGVDVIATRGDEDVGLAIDAVRCDAIEFERNLDDDRLEEALGHYRGDLLAGFFLPGVVEYERWLDRERCRLRDRAAAAAWSLAERALASGQAPEAAKWARTAFDFAPDDEPGLRRLIAVLDQIGDRAGALREYDVFVHRLANEYDAKPSAETGALISRVRRSAPVAVDRTDRVQAGEPGLESDENMKRHMTSGVPAVGGSPSIVRRRLPLIAVAATLLVAVIGLAWSSGRLANAPSASPLAIGVMPFEVRGNADLAYLQEGMVDLLGLKLDGVAGVRSVDPRAALRRDGNVLAPTPDEARDVARRLGLGYYVVGSVVEAGQRIQLTASLYDDSGRLRESVQTAPGERATLFELVDDLARRLLVERFAGPSSQLTRLAATTTRSLPALRAYLEGEQALRMGRHAEAVESFRHAVAEDGDFALAHYRLNVGAQWLRDHALAAASLDSARRHSNRLPAYARRLVDASLSTRERRYAEAESLYLAAIAGRSDVVEAWMGLGDLYYHHNPMRGRSKGEARGPLTRALALDPGQSEARLHLLELAAYEGKVDEIDSLVADLAAGSDFVSKWPLMRALLLDDTAAESRLRRELRALDDRALVRTVIHSVGAFPSNLAGAVRVVSEMTRPARAPMWQAYGHYLASQIEMARGRWAAARSHLVALGSIEPALGTEYGSLFAAATFLPLDRAALEAQRAALVRWNAEPTPPAANSVLATHDGLHVALRLYLLGVLSARLGDVNAADRHADALAKLTSDSNSHAISRALAASVRARASHLRGEPERALAILGEPWRNELSAPSHRQSVILSVVAERYLRAELLAASGRYSEALRAYAAVGDYTIDGIVYLAPSHLRRGEIYAALGDVERARWHLERFVALWRDCDPELIAVRERARTQLSALPSMPGD